MALTQVKTLGIADDAVTEAKVANDAISPTEMKAGTDGHIITYDASGNPTTVGPGTDGQVLTSTGAGSPPAFEAIPAAAVTALNNATANELVTVGSTTTELDAESGLTWDGDELQVHHATDPEIHLNINTHGDAAKIKADSDGMHLTGNGSSNQIRFKTNDTERARLDSSGHLLVGATAKRNVLNQNGDNAGDSPTPLLYAEGTGDSKSLTIVSNNTTAHRGSLIGLARTRGTSVGDSTIIADNDNIGQIVFAAGDGTDTESNVATIRADIDGTPGANDVPGRLAFSTTADGDSRSTERMRINAGGDIYINQNTDGGWGSTSAGVVHIRGNDMSNGLLRINETGGDNNQCWVRFQYNNHGNNCGGIRRNGTSTDPEFFGGSDRRIKTNIADMPNVLDKINQVKIKTWELKSDSDSKGTSPIAQDLATIFPNKVTKTDDGTGDTVPDGVEPWSIGLNYTWELMKAIQELSAEVETLKTKVAALEAG